MPASLYRLVGKPHHTEVTATTPALPAVEESPAISEDLTPVADQVEENLIVEAADIVDPALAPVSEEVEATPVAETATTDDTIEEAAAQPLWDPTWSKAKLLEVAAILNLSVTLDNSKSQIISALTAATST